MKDEIVKEKLQKLKAALLNEGAQTKQMFETYGRFSKGTATDQEMEEANKQFRDVLKAMGLGIFAVLPAAPLTIPLIVKLGEKFGVDVLPDSFKKKSVNKD